MNLVKEAIDLGFSNAAVMDTKQLVFVPEYRNFCEENRCAADSWKLLMIHETVRMRRQGTAGISNYILRSKKDR